MVIEFVGLAFETCAWRLSDSTRVLRVRNGGAERLLAKGVSDCFRGKIEEIVREGACPISLLTAPFQKRALSIHVAQTPDNRVSWRERCGTRSERCPWQQVGAAFSSPGQRWPTLILELTNNLSPLRVEDIHAST